MVAAHDAQPRGRSETAFGLRPLRDPALVLLLAFAVAAPIARPPLIQIGSLRLQACDLLLALSYLAAAAQWLAGRLRLRPSRLMFAGIAFLGALAVSCLLAPRRELRALLKVAAFAPLVLVPLLAAHVITTQERLALLARAWIGGSIIAISVGLVTIAAFYLHRPTADSMMCGYGALAAGNYPRVCAPMIHPNMVADYLITVIPALLLCGALVGPRLRWALILGAGVVAAFTLSTGIGGFAIAAAVAVVVARRRRGKLRLREWALVGAAAAVALLFTAASVNSFVPRGQGHVAVGSRDVKLFDGSRPSIWMGAARTFAAHPLTGEGYGTYVAVVTDPRAYVPADRIGKATGPVRPVRMEAHNVWLSVAGQAGLVGLAAFALLLWAIFGRLRTTRLEDPRVAELPLALVAALVGALAFHGLFAAVEEARHIWLLLAVAAAAAALQAQPAGANRRT